MSNYPRRLKNNEPDKGITLIEVSIVIGVALLALKLINK